MARNFCIWLGFPPLHAYQTNQQCAQSINPTQNHHQLTSLTQFSSLKETLTPKNSGSFTLEGERLLKNPDLHTYLLLVSFPYNRIQSYAERGEKIKEQNLWIKNKAELNLFIELVCKKQATLIEFIKIFLAGYWHVFGGRDFLLGIVMKDVYRDVL